MGGFFGVTSKRECMMDVFFGVDYHSHLGTRRAGSIFQGDWPAKTDPQYREFSLPHKV